jgi:signal peptide peptidase SppA
MRRKFRASLTSSEQFAIEPKALDLEYASDGPASVELADSIAIVSVCGPLEHHRTWMWDSYDDIVERVECALADEDVAAVVLCVDSPGGDAAGAVEAHRKIRALRKQYDKPLYAYSNEAMYSAAYAIGSAADEIWVPDTGGVGSIGVIAALVDRTKANEKAGVKVQLVTTGARKADTHADRELTEDIVETMQERVDQLADVFFDAVAQARGMSWQDVADLQAAVFMGEAGVTAGLADGVAGWDDFLAMVAESTLAIHTSTGTNTVSRAAAQESEMGKLLQLQKRKSEAAAALAGATSDDDRKRLMLAYESSVLALAQAKTTRYKKTTEEEETDDSESDEDEDEKAEDSDADKDEESEDESDEDAEDDDEDDGSTMSTGATEEKSQALLRSKSGLYTHERLFRLCQQVTGKKDVREVFGALDAQGVRLKQAAKLEARIGRLEGEGRRAKVDSSLTTAKREGRITPSQVVSLRAQGMKDPKWLRGYLASLPKIVRSAEDAVMPSLDASAPTLSAQGLSADQQKILEAGARSAGQSVADFGTDVAKRIKNGAGAR